MEFQIVRRVLIRVLLLNWLVAGAKIFIGILSGSLNILAAGFHSILNLVLKPDKIRL